MVASSSNFHCLKIYAKTKQPNAVMRKGNDFGIHKILKDEQ